MIVFRRGITAAFDFRNRELQGEPLLRVRQCFIINVNRTITRYGGNLKFMVELTDHSAGQFINVLVDQIACILVLGIRNLRDLGIQFVPIVFVEIVSDCEHSDQITNNRDVLNCYRIGSTNIGHHTQKQNCHAGSNRGDCTHDARLSLGHTQRQRGQCLLGSFSDRFRKFNIFFRNQLFYIFIKLVVIHWAKSSLFNSFASIFLARNSCCRTVTAGVDVMSDIFCTGRLS